MNFGGKGTKLGNIVDSSLQLVSSVLLDSKSYIWIH